jgi:hypothetical protein
MSTPENKDSLRNRTLWVVFASIAVGVPGFSLWSYRAGYVTKGVTLLSAAIALAVLLPVMFVGFRRAIRALGGALPGSMLGGVLLLGVLSFCVTWIGVSVLQPHNDLLGLALSNTPLSAIQPERKQLLVELIRRKAAISRENDKALADAQKHPIDPQIYSPASFASKEVMESTVAQLATSINLDTDYSKQQQAATDDFRNKMAVCDPAYLETFDESMKERDAADARILQTESAWFEGVKALYDYAASHAGDFVVSNGKINISAPDVHEKFKQSFQQSQAMHDELTKEVASAVKTQKVLKDRYLVP